LRPSLSWLKFRQRSPWPPSKASRSRCLLFNCSPGESYDRKSERNLNRRPSRLTPVRTGVADDFEPSSIVSGRENRCKGRTTGMTTPCEIENGPDATC
jgi:hypothetical protein